MMPDPAPPVEGSDATTPPLPPGAGEPATEPAPPPPDDPLAQALSALSATRAEVEQEWRARVETQALFNLVLEAVPDAVVLVDVRGRVSAANEAAGVLAGRTPKELVGTGAADLFGEEVPASPWQLFDRAPSGRLALDASVAGAGGRVPVTVSCSLLRDLAGRIVGAVYAARDLSETRQLVARLEQAEARWRLIAQLGDLLGRQLDPRESLEETCRWLSRSTGAGVAMVLAKGTEVERVVTWPREGPVAERLAALVLRPLEPGSSLYAAVHGSQTLHAPTLDPDLPLLDRGGVPEGMASAAVVPLVARNMNLGALLVFSSEPGGIRQRALVEQAAGRVAMAVANSELRQVVSRFESDEEAARFREDLMAAVSHDMQTPLAVLLGSIRALQEGDDLSPKERGRLYERMGRRGLQLRRLVQQFLDYSRLGAGRPIVVRPTLTDLRYALTQLEADVAGRRPVTLDMPRDLPAAWVDPDRFDQVLGNLVSNAMKFSPPGSPITVRAAATPTTVEVSVADQGEGMTPADLANVFEKFHRGAGAEGIPGTGLGLYVSRAVLEAQGAELRAASEIGRGSEFTVVLPRQPPPGGDGPTDVRLPLRGRER
ncbi:MAG: ATP-binding protein [Actinomycetota bacterium]|nr:ATP-binding protein [Actinomycetota bacterium]